MIRTHIPAGADAPMRSDSLCGSMACVASTRATGGYAPFTGSVIDPAPWRRA